MTKPFSVDHKKNGKFFKRWEYQTTYLCPDKPVCRSRSNRTGQGTLHWFKIGKGVQQGFVLSFCLLKFYAMYIMWNVALEDSQAGIKCARRNINNLRYVEGEVKSLWMKVKEESEKAGLILNIQKTKIITSSPITSWQIDGETMRDFIVGGSKITVDGDCSHEIKRCLLLGRKGMNNLDSTLKSKDIFCQQRSI